MSRLQLFMIPALAFAVLLFSGVLREPHDPLVSISSGSQPDSLTPMSFSPGQLPDHLKSADPRHILSQAMDKYAPNAMPWLQTAIHQQSGLTEIPYHAQGRYQAGPNQRLYLELKATVKGATAHLTMLSDGIHIYESVHIAGQQPQVTRKTLPQVQHPTDDPASINSAREQFVQNLTFRGVSPLLQHLCQTGKALHLHAMEHEGQSFLEIRGAWQGQTKQAQQLPRALRLRGNPREFRAYLHPETLWPQRIEWWGSNQPSEPLTLLFVTEFRDPILNQPLPAEQCARIFTPTRQMIQEADRAEQD